MTFYCLCITVNRNTRTNVEIQGVTKTMASPFYFCNCGYTWSTTRYDASRKQRSKDYKLENSNNRGPTLVNAKRGTLPSQCLFGYTAQTVFEKHVTHAQPKQGQKKINYYPNMFIFCNGILRAILAHFVVKTHLILQLLNQTY